MSKPDPPAAPDYRGAAEATGESAQANLAQQTWANRPTQITPWGRLDWNAGSAVDPSTGQPVTTWTQAQTLTPNAQAALDTELEHQRYRSGLARDLMGRIGRGYEDEVNFDQFGTIGEMREGAEDAAYSRQASRLDPQWEQKREAMEVRLRNQGLVPGTEAYDRAMESLGREETDAYAQARAQATAEGRQETELSARLRQQEIAEYLQERGVPLNEINAIIHGQQVQQPQMPGFQSAGRAQPTDYLGAARSGYQAELDQFNIENMQRQGMMSGGFGLAGIGLRGMMGGF